MKRILAVRKHEIIHASEGEAGLQAAIDDKPDIILLDLGLPDMDGQTLMSFIKRVPDLKDVPVVAVTAWPEDTAKKMAEAYGCNGFISKPINARTFSDEVGTYLT